MKSTQKVLLFLLICFFSSSSSSPSRAKSKSTNFNDNERQRFKVWKQKHGKVYSSPADEEQALAKVIRNQREIDAHNRLHAQGRVTFTRAIWENSDLDYEEKLKVLTGEKLPPDNETAPVRVVRATSFARGPAEVDWVKAGRVNAVRNQGKCGSCWSYTAVGVAEGVLLKKGDRTRLSEQNLVDCSKANYGCDGGDSGLALRHIAARGVASLADYPYTGRNGRCRKNFKKVNFTLGTVKFERLRGNEERLRDIVASVGPVAIAIDATDSFMNYESGVYNNPRCSKRANHAMLLVGYGYDDKTKMDYWLVKNSWGTSWGEKGYVRMARNKNSQCGIAGEVAYVL